MSIEPAPSPNTPWLRDLLADLRAGLNNEMQTTQSVAVCASAKMSRTEMCAKLGITDTEARMAMVRIGSVMRT
jgi:hypothetical protein